MEDTEQQKQMSTIKVMSPAVTIGPRSETDQITTWMHDAVFRESRSFVRLEHWRTDKGLSDLPSDALLAAIDGRTHGDALLKLRGMLVRIWLSSDGGCTAYLYGTAYSPGDFEAGVAQLKGWLEPKKDEDPGQVRMGFRHYGAGGPSYSARSIEAPAWSTIAGNYAAGVQSVTARLVAEFKPGVGGRLVLFHGAPGTGKTYVIRALAREWRHWCHFEYIADPERFFGDANYMLHVLVEGGDDLDDESEGADERWRMLIVEDAGELLSRDAKVQKGQGLSRLLNLGEGLIGQGLRVMSLISTNDPLGALNEAVSRPGRTAAEVEFTPMSVDEANAWLSSNDAQKRTVTNGMTLAELYALVSGVPYRPQRKSSTIGLAHSLGLRR